MWAPFMPVDGSVMCWGHVTTDWAAPHLGPTFQPTRSETWVRGLVTSAANTDAERQGSRQWGTDTRAGRAGLPGEGALQAQMCRADGVV